MKFDIKEILDKIYNGFLFFAAVFLISLGVYFVIITFGWQLLYLPVILITFYLAGWLWERIIRLIKERMK